MGYYVVCICYVDVVINGDYKGIYLLGEKIKCDFFWVDIFKIQVIDIVGQVVMGGYIVKIDYWDNSNFWQFLYSLIGFLGFDIYMVYYYFVLVDIMLQQKIYIQVFIDGFENVFYGVDFVDLVLGYC